MDIKHQLGRAFNLVKWFVIPGAYGGMDQSEIYARRKRKTLFIIIGGIIMLVVMTVGVILLQDSGIDAPISNDLAVALVLNLSIILVIALTLFVIRNLVKLYFDRRGKVAGSRFQTKLVFAFLAMTLIPTALLFAVATELISDTVDKWLNARIEHTLQESLQVAKSFYHESEQETQANAVYVANIVNRRGLLGRKSRKSLNRLLKLKLREYNVELIQVYNQEFNLVSQAARPNTEVSFDLEDKPGFLARVAFGETITDIEDRSDKSIVVSLAPIAKEREKDQAKGTVVVVKKITKRLIERVHSITKAFEDYKQLTLKKEIIKASYQLTLALVALVIIFSAIWIGFYLARGITVPLRALSEATENVARGDLDTRIDIPPSNDEVGQLLTAFNNMTEDLKNSKGQLELANKDLSESNTELYNRGQYIEAVLDNAAGGVISIDKGGVVTTINDSAAKMFALDAAKSRGRNYRKLFEPGFLDIARQMIRDMSRRGNDTLEREIDLSVKGERRIIKLNISVLRDHNGNYMGIVFMFDDLTDVIAAQRAMAWREMARVVTHEIKNPLTPIQLNVQRMRRKYERHAEDFPKVFDDATNTIIQEVDELKKLVDKFSKMARSSDGLPSSESIEGEGRFSDDTRLTDSKLLELHPEPNMLHDIIYDVVKLYKGTRSDITLATDLDPSINLVNLDAGQIKRVLINLMENAIEAMDGEGEITIRSQWPANKKKVIVEVADTGRGVSKEVRGEVFHPYFSTKPDGAGLGLAIVNRVIEDHGGSISISDNKPRGTVFTIELPME